MHVMCRNTELQSCSFWEERCHSKWKGSASLQTKQSGSASAFPARPDPSAWQHGLLVDTYVTKTPSMSPKMALVSQKSSKAFLGEEIRFFSLLFFYYPLFFLSPPFSHFKTLLSPEFDQPAGRKFALSCLLQKKDREYPRRDLHGLKILYLQSDLNLQSAVTLS